MPETAKLPAPYMSYGVFTKSFDTFAETIVPSGALDRRVLNGFSGNDYSALITGLRFLGLIDDDRKATASYRDLVNLWKQGSSSNAFKERLLKILTDKYKPIVGDLNLEHGTAAQVEKAFKDYGVAQGQMLTKTIRFFLKALTENGCSVSPHMTAPKPRATRTQASKKNGEITRTKGLPDQTGENDEDNTPGGYERLPLPGVPKSFIQYPANLTEAHCQILEAMVGVLKTSVKARTGGKETQ